MTKKEVLEHLCGTVALVYRSKDDYSHPSDGFCHKCADGCGEGWNFRHSGQTLKYVRRAVINQLLRDGIALHPTVAKELGIELEVGR